MEAREVRGREPRPTLARRVLIIGLSNIGDAILMSGVVAAVRAHEPEAHVTLVVGERARAVFVDDPRVQALVDADRFSSIPGRVKLALALWRYRPHVVVDLRHTVYPMLLKPLSAWRYLRRPPRAVGHMRERHRWMLSAQVPDIDPTASGASALWVPPRDDAHVDTLWGRWKLSGGRPVVVICPGARSHIKRWTAEGFARLADRLIAERGSDIVLSGEPDEKPIVDDILSLMRGRAHTAVGLLTVRQLGALMRRARLVITNDSASLHLASAVETPTLAIFGPTDEFKYGPTAPRSRTVRRRLFCTPCEQAACRFNHECMRFIAPEEVYAAACELLAPAHD
jgi:ADP-heptose:LPS heptosyltransferase